MAGNGRYETTSSRSNSHALVIFILGMGILIFVMGPCAGLYSVGLGFVGWVASWVLGITLRVFLLNRSSYDERDRYY